MPKKSNSAAVESTVINSAANAPEVAPVAPVIPPVENVVATPPSPVNEVVVLTKQERKLLALGTIADSHSVEFCEDLPNIVKKAHDAIANISRILSRNGINPDRYASYTTSRVKAVADFEIPDFVRATFSKSDREDFKTANAFSTLMRLGGSKKNDYAGSIALATKKIGSAKPLMEPKE